MSDAWKEDLDFEEYKIQSITLERKQGEVDEWVCKLEYDFEVRWPRGGGRPQPKEGDTVRVFGIIDSKWGPRGAAIGDRMAYYSTNEEHAVWVDQQEAEQIKQLKESFVQRREVLEERHRALPQKLSDQLRATISSHENDSDEEIFLAKHYEEEIVKYEHAHMLALVLDSVSSLGVFRFLPTQSKMGSVWAAMADSRVESLERMLGEELSPEVREKLEEDLAYLGKYSSQRFAIEHTPQALEEIFSITHELLQAEVRH